MQKQPIRYTDIEIDPKTLSLNARAGVLKIQTSNGQGPILPLKLSRNELVLLERTGCFELPVVNKRKWIKLTPKGHALAEAIKLIPAGQ